MHRLTRRIEQIASNQTPGNTARLLEDKELLAAKLVEEAAELAAEKAPARVVEEAADLLYFHPGRNGLGKSFTGRHRS